MDVREDVCTHARRMWQAGLVVGSAGNVSRRAGDGRMAITPASVPYEVMTPEDVVLVDLASGETVDSLRRPSYELPMHLGGTIEVADYAFTGTEAVGTNVVRALGDRTGALLASHGNICVGRDLPHALHVALVMESCAQAYVQALPLGEPAPLPPDAAAAGRRMFEARYKL
jgi:L-fuculose-phosphate aldolase